MNIRDYLEIGVFGAIRSIAVSGIVYPLEYIKVQRQIRTPDKSAATIAFESFKSGGLRRFYDGFYYQTTRSIYSQFYRWPLMIKGPQYLENCESSKSLPQAVHQLIVGTSVSTLDTLATPIEARKIQAIQANGPQTYSMPKAFFTQFLKSSVGFNTFLVGQDFFRTGMKRYLQKDELTIPETTLVGTCVATVVALTTSPVERVSNRILANQKGAQISLKNTARDFRMNFLILVIHNIASVSLIEHLSNHYHLKPSLLVEESCHTKTDKKHSGHNDRKSPNRIQ